MRGEFLNLDGYWLYYYAAGSRDAGEPVLFLYGFPSSSHLWGGVVSSMPGGHRLIVLDQLGYGRSDRPDGARWQCSMRSTYRRPALWGTTWGAPWDSGSRSTPRSA